MIGHLACDLGLAGDMLVGALVDVGVPVDLMQSALDHLQIGRLQLQALPVTVSGVAATKVVVDANDAEPIRRLADARSALDAANLPARVQEWASAVYMRLAQTEAKAHGTAVDAVHFHELGDADTIADIVAACIGFDHLDLENVTCGPVTVGGGTVDTVHGRLQVPAPAVGELLVGHVLVGTGNQEMATPTGAAIVATLTESVSAMPAMRLRRTGRGAGGTASVPRNYVTLMLGDAAEVGPTCHAT